VFRFFLVSSLCTLGKSFVSGDSNSNNNIDNRGKNMESKNSNGNGDKNDERTLCPASVQVCVCECVSSETLWKLSIFFFLCLWSFFNFLFSLSVTTYKKTTSSNGEGLRCWCPGTFFAWVDIFVSVPVCVRS